MEITTSRFGKLKVAKDEIVTFSEGLLGFASSKRFIILNTEGNSPFRWLQSVDDGDLAFIIIEPLNFMFSYDIDLSDDDVAALAIKSAEEVLIYAIVTIPENPKDMTANLQGPLVINAVNRKARQIISGHPTHPLKARILDEMAKREAQIQKAKKSADSDKKEAKG